MAALPVIAGRLFYGAYVNHIEHVYRDDEDEQRDEPCSVKELCDRIQVDELENVL